MFPVSKLALRAMIAFHPLKPIFGKWSPMTNACIPVRKKIQKWTWTFGDPRKTTRKKKRECSMNIFGIAAEKKNPS
jgi:hypothetical protein